MNRFNYFFVYILSLVSVQLTYASTETGSGTPEDTENCLLTFRVQNSELNLHPADISVDYNRAASYIYQDIYSGHSKINGVNITLSSQVEEDFHTLTENNIGQVLEILWCNQVITQATIRDALGGRFNISLPPETANAIYHWAN